MIEIIDKILNIIKESSDFIEGICLGCLLLLLLIYFDAFPSDVDKYITVILVIFISSCSFIAVKISRIYLSDYKQVKKLKQSLDGLGEKEICILIEAIKKDDRTIYSNYDHSLGALVKKGILEHENGSVIYIIPENLWTIIKNHPTFRKQ